MSVENIIRNLRVLWRADRIVAEIQLRRLTAGLLARAFAALFAAFGLLMLELAAYFALVQVWSAIVAAVALGAFNLLFAGLILLIAGRKGASSNEYDVAMALHSSAVEALQAQARTFDAGRSPTHGLEAILPSLVGPAIGLLVKSLRQRKASAAQ